jgi:hypothetical protein
MCSLRKSLYASSGDCIASRSAVYGACAACPDPWVDLQTFGALFGRPLRSRYQPLSDHDRKRHEEDMLAFLLPLPDSELFELQEINLFIPDILNWGSRASHLFRHHGAYWQTLSVFL